MTVSTETRKAGPYSCNGSQTTFSFAFRVFAASEVVVTLASSAGVESTLVLNTNYTVSLNADQDANPGGSITTTGAASPYASGNTITLTSDVADTQGTDLPSGGPWSAPVVERALDRLTVLVQQVRLLVAGALRQPVSDAATIGTLPAKAARLGKFLAFDQTNGDPMAADAVTGVPVTAYAATLLDDTTAAAARTTLGLGTMALEAKTITTRGDSIVGGAAGVLQRLALGTAGYVRTSDGTDDIWMQDSTSGPIRNGYLEWSVSGNALTCALKATGGGDPSPSNPVFVWVRSATAATAALERVTITGALSVTVPDTATLGCANSEAFKVWGLIVNDGGTPRIAVGRCASTSANAGSGRNVDSILSLAAWGIISTTAVGTGSDSALVFYTDSAVTSKGYAVGGYATWESGLATAGTWGTAPTREQAWHPGVPLPGQPIGFSRAISGTASSGNAAALPQDNTIPQSGEGNQLMSTVSITPSSAAHALKVVHVGNYSNDGPATYNACALFRDSTANSIAVNGVMSGAANWWHSPMVVDGIFLASSTSSTTFKARVGNGSNNTFTINGIAGQLYGGSLASTLTVEEIAT